MLSVPRPAALAALALAACLVLAAFPASAAQQPRRAPDGASAVEPRSFTGSGHTVYGDWQATVATDGESWRPTQALALNIGFQFPDTQIAAMAGAGIKVDRLCVLVTAERTFDPDGWMRLASDERMSTLLTPGGLAIEGGVQGAMTTRYGYQFKSPFDQLVTVPVTQLAPGPVAGTHLATFRVAGDLPGNLPPGLYRLRFDFGVLVGTRVYNFNGFAFASRPFSSEAGTNTYFYSPVIAASGRHASGRQVNAGNIQARFPWLLLSNYNSNGYRGVVADEDAARFATSDRSLIPDEVILPMYDEAGTTRLSVLARTAVPRRHDRRVPEHRLGFRERRVHGAHQGPGREHRGPRHLEVRRQVVRLRANHEAVRADHVETAGLRPLRRHRHWFDPGPAGSPLRGWRHVSLLDCQADDAGDGHLPGDGVSGRDDVRARYAIQPGGAGRRERDGEAVRQFGPGQRALSHLFRQGLAGGAVRRRAGHESVPARRAGRIPRAGTRDLHRRRRAPVGQHDASRGHRLFRTAPGRRTWQEAGDRRQVRRTRRNEVRGLRRSGRRAAPRSHHVPLPGRRRPAHRRRRPGREQDRAGPHLSDAGRHVRVGHALEQRRHHEPPHQDVERLFAAHVSRSTSPTSSTTTVLRRDPVSWAASSSPTATCARPTGP